MKKKITALCLVVALLAIMLVGGTLAYFTDTKEATNTFTVGNVKIELTETEWKQPSTVAPGDEFAKKPVVKNVGANDAWIRVDVVLSDAAAFTAAAADHQITDLTTIFRGHDESKWTLAGNPVSDTAADTLTYSYYYNTALTAGTGVTEALFTSVVVPAAFDNTEMAALGDDFTITIKAHAIQTSAANYTTAAGAFANYTA